MMLPSRKIIVAVIALMLVLVWWIAYPLTDRSLIFSVGSEGGAYYEFGQQYVPRLQAEGIAMTVRAGAGSQETLRRLLAGEADAGFVQGGTVESFTDRGLTTLGSMFYEPVWIFHQTDSPIGYLFELRGRAIGVGSEGSGILPIALLLLGENNITEQNSDLIRASVDDTVTALQTGELDAAFFVASPEADYIRTLVNAPNLTLLHIQRAPAYSARYPFMTTLTIPEGLVDLQTNQPRQDTLTLGLTASLVLRTGLHPDMARLLLRTADTIHSRKGLLEDIDEFPSAAFTQLPLHETAENFLAEGITWYEQAFPALVAGPIDRLLRLFVPLFILWTIYQTVTPIYGLVIAYQTTRWYSIFADIERRSDDMTLEELSSNLESLYDLRDRLRKIRVPFFQMPGLYDTRSALEDVIDNLEGDKARLTRPE